MEHFEKDNRNIQLRLDKAKPADMELRLYNADVALTHEDPAKLYNWCIWFLCGHVVVGFEFQIFNILFIQNGTVRTTFYTPMWHDMYIPPKRRAFSLWKINFHNCLERKSLVMGHYRLLFLDMCSSNKWLKQQKSSSHPWGIWSAFHLWFVFHG